MERFTLRKIGKKLLPVAFGIGLLAVGDANSAQAEEVKPVENKTTEETNTSSTKEEVAKVTEAQVQEAKAKLETKTENYNKQAEVVSNLEQQKTAEATVVENFTKEVAELETINKEATPEKIQETKATIETTTNNQSATKAEATEKEKELSELNTQVNTAKSEVTTKEVAENAAKSEVTAAEAKVKEAEAILNGTDQAKVVQELSNAKTNLTAAEKALAEKTAALTAAKQADATREQDLAKALAEKTAAESALKEAQTKATTAQNVYNAVKSDLTTAQSDLTKIQSAVDSINTITLSKEYIENLKISANLNLSTEERDLAEAKLKNLNAQERANNRYKANPNDDTTTLYDVNNLPENIRKELSLFASDLVNQIRKQAGTPKTLVTQSSLDFAKKVGDVYVRDNFDAWSNDNNLIGHHAKGINEVASEYGLTTSPKEMEEIGGQFYENWSGQSAISSKLTYSKLKENIYNSMVGFMLNGFEWIHAQSVAGIDYLETPSEAYLGIDFAKVGTYGGIHLLMVNKSEVENSTKNNFNTTEIPNTNTSEKLLSDLEVKKQEVTAIQNELTRVAAEKTAAESALKEAQTKATTANTKLAAIENKGLLTPTAQAENDKAQADAKAAKERLSKAQQSYDLLNADVKAKEANVEKAKEELAKKQSALETAKSATKDSQAKLAGLLEDVKDTQNELTTLKTKITNLEQELENQRVYLTKLENAPELLAAAKDKQAKAKANLILTETKLTNEKNKLQELLTLKETCQQHYDELLQQLELQERLYIYQTGAGTFAVPLSAPTVEVKPELSLELVKEQQKVQTTTGSVKQTPKGERVLPKTTAQETGVNSQAGLTLAGALAIAGLVAGRRKERE